jgi:hypothetical protein
MADEDNVKRTKSQDVKVTSEAWLGTLTAVDQHEDGLSVISRYARVAQARAR